MKKLIIYTFNICSQRNFEKIIGKEERNYYLLQEIVKNIFEVFKITEEKLINSFPEKELGRTLPEDIFFISSQELEVIYPDASPKEREHILAKEKGAVFLPQLEKS